MFAVGMKKIAMPGAAVVIGLNYWLSPEEAARREMVLEEGRSLVRRRGAAARFQGGCGIDGDLLVPV